MQGDEAVRFMDLQVLAGDPDVCEHNTTLDGPYYAVFCVLCDVRVRRSCVLCAVLCAVYEGRVV